MVQLAIRCQNWKVSHIVRLGSHSLLSRITECCHRIWILLPGSWHAYVHISQPAIEISDICLMDFLVCWIIAWLCWNQTLTLIKAHGLCTRLVSQSIYLTRTFRFSRVSGAEESEQSQERTVPLVWINGAWICQSFYKGVENIFDIFA